MEVRRRVRAASGRVALIADAVVLPTGWFYGRNLVLYGSLDGSTRAVPAWAARGPSVVDNATSARFWLDEYRQLWGYVTDNARLPGIWAVVSEVLLDLAVAGLAASLVGWLRNGASATRMTTLPNCSPLASRSKAARPFSMSHTESTGGSSRPAASCSATILNSASFPMVEPRMVH